MPLTLTLLALPVLQSCGGLATYVEATLETQAAMDDGGCQGRSCFVQLVLIAAGTQHIRVSVFNLYRTHVGLISIFCYCTQLL